MTTFKLTRNSSSSLSRSPTLKSGIDSLVSLEEGVAHVNSHGDRTWQHELTGKSSTEAPHHFHTHIRAESPHYYARTESPRYYNRSDSPHGYGRATESRHGHGPSSEGHHQYHYQRVPLTTDTSLPSTSLRVKGFRMRLLLPPVVIVVFPCVYFYARVIPHQNNMGLLIPTDAGSFDYIALIFFFSAVLVSVKIAYPHMNLLYRFRAVFGHRRGCLSLSCLKPLTAFLAASKQGKQMFSRGSSVIWTIGSKSRSDKLNTAKEGVQIYSNGDVYEGEFHQGRYSGSGVYHFYMSGKYEGDWVDGKYDGYGVETWARGSRYRGQYKRGLREGYGVYRFYTGDVYSGEWANGQSHGYGVQTCEDGSRYVGEFKWGVKHGIGYYHFRNGDTYAGEYFADKMHGYGVYQFANGHRYEGAWHEGRRQGLGMYTFRNGEIQAGNWHAGVLKTPSTHNSDGSVTVAISHSKVLHVVQEARRAAAKAHNVPHVDERVNKAVAAANRAANAARVAAVKAVQNKMPDVSSHR